jgi:hypothetical protein
VIKRPRTDYSAGPLRPLDERAAARVLARQEMEAGARMTPRTSDVPMVDIGQIHHFIAMTRPLLARQMDLVAANAELGIPRGALLVVQRCRACRAEIKSPITETLRAGPDWMSLLGSLIRYDYDSHLCSPIALQMHALTIEQLDELLQGAEHEGQRCMARSEEIRKALDRALDQRDRAKETT